MYSYIYIYTYICCNVYIYIEVHYIQVSLFTGKSLHDTRWHGDVSCHSADGEAYSEVIEGRPAGYNVYLVTWRMGPHLVPSGKLTWQWKSAFSNTSTNHGSISCLSLLECKWLVKGVAKPFITRPTRLRGRKLVMITNHLQV